MRKQFFRAFILFGLFISVTAGSALAQVPEKIVVDIPFEFVVGDKTLAAGEYTVKNVSTGRTDALLFKSADGRSAAMILTNAIQSGSTNRDARLVFTQYGDRHFLSQVWAAGADTGRVIPKTRTQREAEKEVRAANAEPPVVTLMGRR